jgi:hypothetical protein
LESKRAEQILPGGRVGGFVTQIMYTHVIKCKNDKKKKRSCCGVGTTDRGRVNGEDEGE